MRIRTKFIKNAYQKIRNLEVYPLSSFVSEVTNAKLCEEQIQGNFFYCLHLLNILFAKMHVCIIIISVTLIR